MKINKGSSLVEYALPLALLGIVVGLGLFSIAGNGGLKSAVYNQSGGKEDLLTSKFTMGANALTKGVYKDDKGNIALYNEFGQSVSLDQGYLDKYKEDLLQYLNDDKFTFKNDSAVATETSGAAGILNETNSAADQSYMLATLIEIAANNYDEPTVKELLENMSVYGKELAVLEDNLVIIDEKIKNKQEVFGTKEDYYNQIEADFAQKLALYNEDKISIEDLRQAHEKLENSYDEYEESVEGIKKTTSDYIAMSEAYFEDLKNNTGVKFDDVLDQIKASTIIDQNVKDLTLPIAEDIKATKDSADLIKQTIDYIKGTFDSDNSTYEEFQEQFETIEFEIQQANNNNNNGNNNNNN